MIVNAQNINYNSKFDQNRGKCLFPQSFKAKVKQLLQKQQERF